MTCLKLTTLDRRIVNRLYPSYILLSTKLVNILILGMLTVTEVKGHASNGTAEILLGTPLDLMLVFLRVDGELSKSVYLPL